MASVRKLKKDIDLLVFELISDCFAYGGLHPEDKGDEVSEIIAEAVTLRNNLISRVNNPVKDDGSGNRKTHFQQVKRDLVTSIDKLFLRLSGISGKKA
jgi:hypothetical protein